MLNNIETAKDCVCTKKHVCGRECVVCERECVVGVRASLRLWAANGAHTSRCHIDNHTGVVVKAEMLLIHKLVRREQENYHHQRNGLPCTRFEFPK